MRKSLDSRVSNTISSALTAYADSWRGETSLSSPSFFVPPERLIVCGMGGSALAAGVYTRLAIAKKSTTPRASQVIVHRNFGLPDVVNDPEELSHLSTKVLCVSYSGETRETLDAFKEAWNRRLETVVVTSGGTLAEEARLGGVPIIELPKVAVPRHAIGHMLQAILKIMCDKQISSACAAAALMFDEKRVLSQALRLSEFIGDRTPLFYSSEQNAPLAYIFKIFWNETAKRHAFTAVVPELCHNELSAFSDPQSFVPIFINDPFDTEEAKKRFKTMEILLAERKIESALVFEDHVTANIQTAHYHDADMVLEATAQALAVSTVSASVRAIDPIHTPLIDEFKQRMS